MRMLPSRRRSWRVSAPALLLAGILAGSLVGLAVAATRAATSTVLAPTRADAIHTDRPVGRHTGRIDTRERQAAPSLRSAGRFLLAEIEHKVAGEWGEAWQSLYPAHQRVAPRDAFIRCEMATPFPLPLESIHVVRVRAARVDVPGVVHAVPGAAVTVAVELRWYGPRDPITFRHTFHLVPVWGRWTWLLSRDRYNLYDRGACSARPVA